MTVSVHIARAYLGSVRTIPAILLFNNVILMLLVTVLSDPSCFLYALTNQPRIKTTYETQLCDITENTLSGTTYTLYEPVSNSIEFWPSLLCNN